MISTVAACLFETQEIEWSNEMIGSLIWSIFGISIGAMSLLFILIRRGNATKVSSMMYLTPPTTAILAWLIFNEPLTLLIIMGTVVTSLGVLLVNQPLPNFLRRHPDKELK